MVSLTIEGSCRLKGTLEVPGDKSISHRSLILSALRKCPILISNLNDGEDVHRTRQALESLGILIEDQGAGRGVSVKSAGSFTKPSSPLYLGNSGTSARLLMGLLASQGFEVGLTGDSSLEKRPMKRVMEPLSLMGAMFESENGCLPIVQQGCFPLRSITYRLSVPSAQLKSALLIAALSAKGISRIIEPEPSRDHTERLMTFLGMPLKIHKSEGERVLEVEGVYAPKAQDKQIHLEVPGDPSAAAFWIVAALVVSNSKLRIDNICWNSYRNVFVRILEKMGAKIQIIPHLPQMGEECVDLIAETSQLQAVQIQGDLAPSLIDEYPILAVAAAFAKGQSVFRGLQELRFKECDRLQVILDSLKACGVRCFVQNDDLFIEGGSFAPLATEINIDPQHDHRIAMAFSIFALAYHQPITIHQTEVTQTSYPDFYKILENLR